LFCENFIGRGETFLQEATTTKSQIKEEVVPYRKAITNKVANNKAKAVNNNHNDAPEDVKNRRYKLSY